MTHATSPSRSSTSGILITGSTTGLGRLAARQLAADGQDVILHARSPETAATLPGSALAADPPRRMRSSPRWQT